MIFMEEEDMNFKPAISYSEADDVNSKLLTKSNDLA